MPEEVKFEFGIIEFDCPVDGPHFRYTLHKDGWQWGRFTDRNKCEEIGRLHFNRAVKHGNDWGIPNKELRRMNHIPRDVGDYI